MRSLWRSIHAGSFPAQRRDDGGVAIYPAELLRVFQPQRPKERPMEQDAMALSGGFGTAPGDDQLTPTSRRLMVNRR